jgi:hypothetical protein
LHYRSLRTSSKMVSELSSPSPRTRSLRQMVFTRPSLRELGSSHVPGFAPKMTFLRALAPVPGTGSEASLTTLTSRVRILTPPPASTRMTLVVETSDPPSCNYYRQPPSGAFNATDRATLWCMNWNGEAWRRPRLENVCLSKEQATSVCFEFSSDRSSSK